MFLNFFRGPPGPPGPPGPAGATGPAGLDSTTADQLVTNMVRLTVRLGELEFVVTSQEREIKALKRVVYNLNKKLGTKDDVAV